MGTTYLFIWLNVSRRTARGEEDLPIIYPIVYFVIKHLGSYYLEKTADWRELTEYYKKRGKKNKEFKSKEEAVTMQITRQIILFFL